MSIDQSPRPGEPSGADQLALQGIWLTAELPVAGIELLLLDMLAPSQQDLGLRQSIIEELSRGAKRTEAALTYLGLELVGTDTTDEIPLHLARPKPGRDPWRDALIIADGDCPVGFLFDTVEDHPLVLVHEVFADFPEPQKALVRRYAIMASRRASHARIVAELRDGAAGPQVFSRVLTQARRHAQALDPSVLFSADGDIRVQVGSVSQTTKDVMRGGLHGEQLFILPVTLFAGKTNYGDVEFLVYLNFFARQKLRTRIVGTERQREILSRLLTITLFGVFDPATERPSFEKLREEYAVPDQDTYQFLLTAYELYGIRKGDGDSPMLGIDDYVDFIPLEPGENVVPIAAGNVRITQRDQSFDVQIDLSDGRNTAKRLEVSPPHRLQRVVPEEMRRAVRFATERPQFGITTLGTSHGFDPAGDLTSFVLWVNGKGILVDPSPESLGYLRQMGVAEIDVPYVFLTHVHADHDGGLLEKLLSGSRTTVIASDPVFRTFAEKAQLITGHDFHQRGLVKHVPANPGTRVRIEVAGSVATLETRWNLHPIPTNGFKMTFGGRTFGYSGDTQYDPALLDRLRAQGKLGAAHHDDLLFFFWTPDGEPIVTRAYHEAGIPPIHTDKEFLRALPDPVKERVGLVHIADRDVPEAFAPAKPPLWGTEVLVPPSVRSRHRILVETLRLVGYMFDLPTETLDELLNGGEIRLCRAGELVIRKGFIPKDQPIDFYVIADGEMSVQDGRRVLTRLGKADTFGEWGISHQRGFRAADVVTGRPSQLLQFSEAQYHWLVGKHPVIQERISKIRSLLPQLQQAQGRARLKVESGLSRQRSVIQDMSTSQLTSFAIFSKVMPFRQGQIIVAQGEKADGFYIVLSGHLIVRVEGRTIGEISEGDVFGEMGLLEGGRREANVSVASADADVLFMSTKSFQGLLQSVPAFAWGIWETAAARRESNAGPRARRSTDR